MTVQDALALWRAATNRRDQMMAQVRRPDCWTGVNYNRVNYNKSGALTCMRAHLLWS